MIIISTREQKAQNVILNALFNITNLTIRIDGELIISLNEEDETIKIFLSLLHQNLVGSVEFRYEEEPKPTDEDVPKVENSCVIDAETHEKQNTQDKQKEQVSNVINKTPSGIVRDFFKENENKFFTIKEVSDITGLKYPTVAGVIRSIYLKSKFLVRTEDKKYGHIDPEQVQEKNSSEHMSNAVEQEQEESGSEPTLKVEVQVQEKPSSESILNVEEQIQEESSNITLTVEEKSKIMKELFSKERNLDVLRYIFPGKGSFVVSLAQKKFIGEAQEDLTRIIRTLSELEVITFDEEFKGGRYFINPRWRLWVFLFLKGKPQTKESIKYEISMSDSELQENIKQAVSENIIIETQKEGKRPTYSVL